MGKPAAKQGDWIMGSDMHVVMVPAGSSLVPLRLPHAFSGKLDAGLSEDVLIMKKPAATVESTATNTPPHVPTSPGTSFQKPPENKGTVRRGSKTVFINGKAAARHGDAAETCNDPVNRLAGRVTIPTGTVIIG
jgi:uncharacterized Zn-binding protein involved in type VI secretion